MTLLAQFMRQPIFLAVLNPPPNNSPGGNYYLPGLGVSEGGGNYLGGGIITVRGYPKNFLRRFAPEVMFSCIPNW